MFMKQILQNLRSGAAVITDAPTPANCSPHTNSRAPYREEDQRGSSRFGSVVRYSAKYLVAYPAVAFLGTLLLLAFTPIGSRLGGYLSQSTPMEALSKSDVAIVLGGDEIRAVDAARLYEAEIVKNLIISGDVSRLSDILRLCNVPWERVQEDTAPTCTADHPQTLLALPSMTKERPIVLVTSDYHQFRARRIFTKAGYTSVDVYSSQPDRSRTYWHRGVRPKDAFSMIYELTAFTKDWLNGDA